MKEVCRMCEGKGKVEYAPELSDWWHIAAVVIWILLFSALGFIFGFMIGKV